MHNAKAIKVVPDARPELARWLGPVLKKGATRIVLQQWTTADTEHPVCEWDQAERAAERDAETMRGLTRYAVTAWRGDAKAYFARELITIAGNPDGGLRETERADLGGIVSMLMRHTEAAVKMSIGAIAQITQTKDAELQRANARIEMLEGREWEATKLRAELIDNKHARDLEIRKIERGEKNAEEMIKLARQYGPLLLAKYAKSGVAGSVLKEEILSGFFESLTQAQVDEIRAGHLHFTEAQQSMLAQMFIAYAERAGAKAEAKKDEPKPPPNGPSVIDAEVEPTP